MTKNIKILQDNDKALLKSKSAQALPNSPSNRGRRIKLDLSFTSLSCYFLNG